MPFNGSGIYNLPVTTVTPAVSGTTIDDSEFNAFTADLKDALTNCIVKDGQTTSPTLTTPSIVTPTISGSPVFTADILMGKASPALSLRPTDEVTQNTSINYFDETATPRAVLYRPLGASKVRLDARNASGVVQAALDITEAGGIDVAVGTFSATSAALTTPALTNATGSLTSPVINTGVSGTAELKGIHFLDNPETLFSISAVGNLGTSGAWTSSSGFASTTLPDASATAAIIRVFYRVSWLTTTDVFSTFSLRKAGEIATTGMTIAGQRGNLSANALNQAYVVGEATIPLDGSSDFEYQFSFSSTPTLAQTGGIYLVGYYI